MNIAILDDNPDDIYIVKKICENKGHEVTGFQSKSSLINDDRDYDIILLDIFLNNGADGLQVADVLCRSHGYLETVVMIYSSSLTFEESDRYPYLLKKPFEYDKFIENYQELKEDIPINLFNILCHVINNKHL